MAQILGGWLGRPYTAATPNPGLLRGKAGGSREGAKARKGAKVRVQQLERSHEEH